MWVLQDLVVCGGDWRTVDSCGCDDELVGWVAMKRRRELGRFDHNSGRQIHELDPWVAEPLLEPLLDSAWKLESAVLGELCDLSAGYDADAKPCWRS